MDPDPRPHGRRESPSARAAREALSRPPRGRPRPEVERPGPLLQLEGAVEEGVEHGAVVLRTEAAGTWLLGAAQRHLVGHRVRVRGSEVVGLLTTAQQGPPLAVEDVEDLGPL